MEINFEKVQEEKEMYADMNIQAHVMRILTSFQPSSYLLTLPGTMWNASEDQGRMERPHSG